MCIAAIYGPVTGNIAYSQNPPAVFFKIQTPDGAKNIKAVDAQAAYLKENGITQGIYLAVFGEMKTREGITYYLSRRVLPDPENTGTQNPGAGFYIYPGQAAPPTARLPVIKTYTKTDVKTALGEKIILKNREEKEEPK